MITTLRQLLVRDFAVSSAPQENIAPDSIDTGRRQMLAGAPLALAGLGMLPGSVSASATEEFKPWDDGFIHLTDPREKFKALFRLERDLQDEGTALSTYQFLMYALPQGARPQPIVRWEGMEFSYFRRVGDMTWRIHAHNVSYPRDLVTGQFTSSALNPYTNEELRVEPLRLLDDPGVLHGPQGYLVLDATTPNWLDSYHSLRIEGPLIKSEHIRPMPEGWPEEFIESGCSAVSREDFYNPAVTALPFQTSGFYVFPFPAWMRMGDRPGLMLGAWSGRRVMNGSAELPREFRERVAQETPELLRPRWEELETPLSAVVQEALQA